MKTIRLLIINTLPQVMGKVVTAGSTLLITRLIADVHGLGRDGYGNFTIITIYAAYFYILTDFGLNAIAVKDITADEERLPQYMSNLLSMRLMMSVSLIILGLMILAFLPYSPAVKLGCMLMLLTIVSQGVLTNSNIVFQYKLRYDQSMLATVLGSIVSLALVYITYRAHGGLFGYLLSMVAGSAIMGISAVWLSGRYTPVRLRFDWSIWRELFWQALPLGITIIFNLAYFKADSFILSVAHFAPWLHLTNEQAAGLYNMAYKVFEVVLVLPIFFVNVLYPIMVKTAQRDVYELRSLVVKSLAGLLGLSIIGSALMYVASPLIIQIVSSNNPDFHPSIQVLQWLGLTLPLFFLTNTLLWTIMTLGRQKVLAFFYFISAVVNVSLNLWLIPQYGYLAAAVTTGITEIVTLILLGVTVWHLLHGSKLKEIAAQQQLSVAAASEVSGGGAA